MLGASLRRDPRAAATPNKPIQSWNNTTINLEYPPRLHYNIPALKLRNNHFSEGENITRAVNIPVWWILGQEAHFCLETSNLNSPSGLAAPEQHRQGSMDNLECVPHSCHHGGTAGASLKGMEKQGTKTARRGLHSQKNKG